MAYTQPYVEALAERLLPLEGLELPRVERVILLEFGEALLCRSLGGELLATVPLDAWAARQLEALAEVLGCGVEDLALEGEVVRQTLKEVRPLVCKRRTHPRWRFEPSLGEGTVVVDETQLPADGAIQAIREARHFVTARKETTCWLTYTSKQAICFKAGRQEILEAVGVFPPAPAWPAAALRGALSCEVYSCQRRLEVKKLLDEHAARTKDRPIPRYQMIVDPNQFVTETAEGPVWVPCEFDVDRSGRAELVGGGRAHAQPALAQQVARPIFEAALPLLAKLRRPQLLLEERRLQVAFKAQRILLPPKGEYMGLWHVDGLRERVAAVVLYYYHVDPALQGGAMEFCGREPIDVLGVGDCSNNYMHFNGEALRSALREQRLPHCRVPICEGTLLVFSNYQLAHRVLSMVNSGSHEVSRDFVALFVLDPAWPLRPARSLLSRGFLEARALHEKLGNQGLRRVQEFLGHWPSRRERRALRDRLLAEQLRPSGEICGGSQVVATGNGCYSMIGWLHHVLEQKDLEMFGEDWPGAKLLRGLNTKPSEGRGMSEALSLETQELEWRLEELEWIRE